MTDKQHAIDAGTIGVAMRVDFWATPNPGQTFDEMRAAIEARGIHEILEVDLAGQRIRLCDKEVQS